MDSMAIFSSDLFFPQSNNTLEGVCTVEDEEIEVLVCLAVCLKTFGTDRI